MSFLFIWLTYSFILISWIESLHINVIIVTQNFSYELGHAYLLRTSLQEQSVAELKVDTIFTHEYFEKTIGTWAIWPSLRQLASSRMMESNWTILCEPYTKINASKLVSFLNDLDPQEDWLISRGLKDKNPVIIHHFYGYDGSELTYPDFASGLVFSKSLLKKFAESLSTKAANSDFTIDPKFELAKMVKDITGVRLTNSDRFCLLANEKSPSCVTSYEEPMYERKEDGNCGLGVTNEDVFFGVKTFSGFHRSRLVFVKRTWGKHAKYIEYFSDTEDPYVPTVDIGIPNTKKGHCMKTMAIFKHFFEHKETTNVSWIVIADDDTLLSIPRLYRLLNCLPASQRLIFGERYGYGFSTNGYEGYDYPTGGSGMVFSRSAAQELADRCFCPSNDSPDDMIIGMCARRFGIQILHSAAFHQARPMDYSDLYLKRIKPISFHKFEELNPYEVYMQWLHEEMPKTNMYQFHESKKHVEL